MDLQLSLKIIISTELRQSNGCTECMNNNDDYKDNNNHKTTTTYMDSVNLLVLEKQETTRLSDYKRMLTETARIVVINPTQRT